MFSLPHRWGANLQTARRRGQSFAGQGSLDVEFSDLHCCETQAGEARVCKDILGQGVDWLCLGSGRETRWDTELDGFFASFRREVGRRPFNTAGPSLQTAANMEQHLHERVRRFQFAC